MLKSLFKAISLCILYFLPLAYCSAQIEFEEGYIITKANEKKTCWIKNVDWFNNPEEIEYQITKGGETIKATTKDIQEFGITSYSRFVKVEVEIDRTSNKIEKLYSQRAPKWSKESLFLKVLIAGATNLYSYRDNDLLRFFYDNKAGIKQLVYKRYLNNTGAIATNTRFKQQLWKDINCKDVPINKLGNISYSQKALEKHFITYSECKNIPYTTYNKKEATNLFHVSITPGVSLASLEILRNKSFSLFSFKSKPIARVGLELEYILPYNKNTWGLLFEPTYQKYKDETTANNITAFLDYTSLEFSAGIRHFIFLNKKKKNKLFFDALYVSNLTIDSEISFSYSDGREYPSLTRASFALGAGLEKGRMKGGVRYYFDREIIAGFLIPSSSYKRLSFYAGYRLIDSK